MLNVPYPRRMSVAQLGVGRGEEGGGGEVGECFLRRLGAMISWCGILIALFVVLSHYRSSSTILVFA